MKAKEMLAKSQSVAQRAESFVSSVKRNIQRKIIDTLTAKMEALDDELFGLQDFSLETNLNNGKSQMSRDEVEKAFTRMIEIEYEKELLQLEIEAKTKAFNSYFDSVEEEEEKAQ